jgi:inner membrane protein
MDSVTQFVLGGAVGAALLGPRIGARRAALIGGLYGTLPDLDTFVPAADPVSSFTTHRGPTHSLLVQALATPLFAEPLVRLIADLRDKRIVTYLAVYLVFATHALIDAMTVYGTQLFWPVAAEPVGVGSIFIIDPLYTLPLLGVVMWALFVKGWGPRYKRWLQGALAVSTAYMAFTVVAQTWVEARAERLLAAKGIVPERTLAIPTPFNTLYWRTIAIDGERYLNVYLPLFGDDKVTIYAHPRHPELAACLEGTPAYRTLAAFTDGYFRLERDGDKIVFADLRMGLTPNYTFRFALAEFTPDGARPLGQPTRERGPRSADGDYRWLFSGIAGDAGPRPIEAPAMVALNELAPLGSGRMTLACGPAGSGVHG